MAKLGVTRIVSHTTRAPRIGEIDGVDYNFVSDAEFSKMRENREFYQFVKRESSDGKRSKYGTTIKSLSHDGDIAQVLDLQGVRDMSLYCRDFDYQLIVINVHANEDIRMKRYLSPR